MALKFLSSSGKEVEFTEVQAEKNDANNLVFHLSPEDETSSIDFEFPFTVDTSKQLLSDILDKNPSKVFVFKNKVFKANDILEFRIERSNALRYDGKPSENGCIGCIFSLDALFDEDTFQNTSMPYATSYACIALHLILANSSKVSLAPKPLQEGYRTEETFRDLYDDEDTVFLVVGEKYLAEGFEFKIENYLCSLFKFGFYLAQQHDLSDANWYWNRSRFIEEHYSDASIHKRIKTETSSSLIDVVSPTSYYYVLLHRHIQQIVDPLTRFLILYQVIELLKDKVLAKEIHQLLAYETNPNGYQLRKRVINLDDGELIRKLFGSNYNTCNEIVTGKLQEKIKIFLASANPTEEKEGLPALLYQLRNHLFHKFSAFPQSSSTFNELKILNQLFELIIIELIASYREPNIVNTYPKSNPISLR